MLKMNNISTTLNGKKILDNISLEVGHGKIALLLGASGVGKSTLLRVLNNLEPLDSGYLELDGNKFSLKDVSISNSVGMVFQHFNLFDHLTVKDNVTLALEKIHKKSKRKAKQIATELLEHYGLKDLINTYPGKLSGGQKQRLAIARAIALKPKVLCFDEPTSALDPMLTRSVADNIKELTKQNYIILVASHDTLLVEKLPCDIYLLQSGRIVQSVNSEDFWKNKEKYDLINHFISGNK